jgi:hypothetical protein
MEKGFWNEATEPSDGPDFSSMPDSMGQGFLINYGECEKISVDLSDGILSMKPSATASARISQMFGGMFYILVSMLGVLSLFGFIIAVIQGRLMEDVFNAEGGWLTMFGFMAIAPWMIVLASGNFNGFRTLMFDAAAGSVSSEPKPIAVGKVKTFKHEKVQAIVVRNHDYEETQYHPKAQMKYSDSLEPGVYLLTTEGLHGIFSLLSPEVAGDATGPLAEYYGVEVFINPDNEVEYTRKHEMM